MLPSLCIVYGHCFVHIPAWLHLYSKVYSIYYNCDALFQNLGTFGGKMIENLIKQRITKIRNKANNVKYVEQLVEKDPSDPFLKLISSFNL